MQEHVDSLAHSIDTSTCIYAHSILDDPTLH